MNYISSDHAGLSLKSYLTACFPLTDLGPFSSEPFDYPLSAESLSLAL
jgi:hypothetical protein